MIKKLNLSDLVKEKNINILVVLHKVMMFIFGEIHIKDSWEI